MGSTASTSKPPFSKVVGKFTAYQAGADNRNFARALSFESVTKSSIVIEIINAHDLISGITTHRWPNKFSAQG